MCHLTFEDNLQSDVWTYGVHFDQIYEESCGVTMSSF